MTTEATAPACGPVELSRQLGAPADRRTDILRRIRDTGSISEAARTAGISYKAAWQAVESLSSMAGRPVVEKVVGGAGGGGTRLTETGEMVLDLCQALASAREKALREFLAGKGRRCPQAAACMLKTSIRNVLPAEIRKISSGAALVHVFMDLGAGSTLRAAVTRESVELLQLERGMEVAALIKATSVRICRSFETAGKENILRGVVARSSRGARGGEMTLRLPGGAGIIGFCPPGHGLSKGDEAQAAIAANAVAIALP